MQPRPFSPNEPDPTPYGEGNLLHFLLEHIPDKIYFKDRLCRFVNASRATADFHGVTDRSELKGKTDFDFFTREHAQAAFDDEQRIMGTGVPITGKVEKETLPDGEIRWALTTKMALCDEAGGIIGTCGISKDFTAMKAMEDALQSSNAALAERQAELEQALARLEEAHKKLKSAQLQLIEAEKIQSNAKLVAGLAHEVRNPLNILTTGVALIKDDAAITGSPMAAEILHEMEKAVRRADAVISALTDDTGTASLQTSDAEVSLLIDHALALVQDELAKSQIELVRNVAQDLPPVAVEAATMERALAAVLLNAIQSMAGKGVLTVSADLREVAAEKTWRDPGLRSGRPLRAGSQVVCIEIADTGTGVPAEDLAKVFDPFFTTKETGDGTGLGLTVARKIIEMHGGIIGIANRVSGGASVTILLRPPRSPNA